MVGPWICRGGGTQFPDTSLDCDGDQISHNTVQVAWAVAVAGCAGVAAAAIPAAGAVSRRCSSLHHNSRSCRRFGVGSLACMLAFVCGIEYAGFLIGRAALKARGFC